MAISIAAEWNELYNRFYRKQEIYTMCWNNVDLSRHKVACAKFGGPIAMVRDESKMVQLRAESARAKLLLFSSSGKLLSSVPWDRPGGRLISLGWTDEEILLCVVHDGTIFQYNIHGELLPQQLSLGKECWDQGVADCVIWGSGVVVITEQNQLFSIPNLEDQKVIKLADPHLEEPPHCLVVIEPQYTLSGHLEVLLAVGSAVLMVDRDTVQDQMVSIGPIQKMTLSSNGTFLACFTHEGRLLVVTTDFAKTLSEFTTEVSGDVTVIRLSYILSVQNSSLHSIFNYVCQFVCGKDEVDSLLLGDGNHTDPIQKLITLESTQTLQRIFGYL